jgi:hypothetical protein
LTTPIPGGCQPSIDTTPSIKEIIASTSIEGVPKKIGENGFLEGLSAAEGVDESGKKNRGFFFSILMIMISLMMMRKEI